MIEPKDFVEAARELGFIRYTGVPCSFLTPFINYVINDNSLEYISSSNEGDALATTSGSVIGGQRSIVMMQNSGLGNIVNPLMSLVDSEVYSIPLLLMIGWRGEPNVKDEPQHKKQGKITLKQLELLDIEYYILANFFQSYLKGSRYLAENFVAFFNRDYEKVARLHVECEWVPKDTNISLCCGSISPLNTICFFLSLSIRGTSSPSEYLIFQFP